MLKSGHPPDDWDQLLIEVRRDEQSQEAMRSLAEQAQNQDMGY
jgi:toxin YhaV